MFSLTVSNLDKVKNGKFGINASVCFTTEKMSEVKLSKSLVMWFTLFYYRKDVRSQVIQITSDLIYFVLKSSQK